MRFTFFTSCAIAVLVSACGRTGPLAGTWVAGDAGAPAATGGAGSQAGGRAAGGEPNGGGSASAGGAGTAGAAGSAGMATTLCSAAGWSSESRPVAIGWSGVDVIVVNADGSRRIAATLGKAAGFAEGDLIKGISTSADGVQAWAAWRGPVFDDGETVLLDRAGQVIWQLPGFVRTAVRAGMVAESAGRHVRVLADGTTARLPLGEIQSFHAADRIQSDGWLAARWFYPEEEKGHFGFVNLDGRPAREPLASPAGPNGSMSSHEGQAYYLANPSSLSLYLETPTEVRSIALGMNVPPASTPLAFRSKSRILVSLDSRLVRLVEPMSGAVTVVDSAALDATRGTDSFGSQQSYQVATTPDTDFALGYDGQAPRFVLDTRSGDIEPVLLDRLAPLRPVDSMYCGDTLVLADGRLGVALRDAALAGFYVGNPNGTGVERLGLPFRDVTAISAQQVASSWVLRGVSGGNTFCTPYQPFAPAASGEPGVLEGDSVQILAPGVAPFVLPAPAPGVALDATGLCAIATWSFDDPALNETRVYDVTTGTSTALEGLTEVTWL